MSQISRSLRWFIVDLGSTTVVFTGFIAIFPGLWSFTAWLDNRTFAHGFFRDRFEVTRIVASKRWHDLSDKHLACTWAAVEFSEETAQLIRKYGPSITTVGAGRREGLLPWTNRWATTPIAPYTENRMQSPLDCIHDLPDPDRKMLKTAMRSPGNWYYERGQIGQFLSVNLKIAASFRFGD